MALLAYLLIVMFFVLGAISIIDLCLDVIQWKKLLVQTSLFFSTFLIILLVLQIKAGT